MNLEHNQATLLETVLGEFGIPGKVERVHAGPVITRYEFVPGKGTKMSRVMALSDDLARNMAVQSCRVSAVPGRNSIGIEIPNADRKTVELRTLMPWLNYEASGELPMILGETIEGDPYVVDLTKMPHLLIGGTTGSGKSVGVNAMILSIIARMPASKVQFLMIDPKMLELSVYNGIPHLTQPVVTDPHRAVEALQGVVKEMEERYSLMSKMGVRNIQSFNETVKKAKSEGRKFIVSKYLGDNEDGRPVYQEVRTDMAPMPYMVVVIDEVADLMMVAGKQVEAAVQRLAQMARAAGIHLIMATQRPSVDVITGTIKSNFPTRIAFQVSSAIDSRTILGEQGAEKLLGKGDMIYMAGGGNHTRVHGAFVSDQAVEDMVKHIRQGMKLVA